jgi:hypothetical protein
MSEFNFSLWEKILQCHFQDQRNYEIRPHVVFKLIINLEAVNCGLKPGFLWDIKEITMEETQLLSLIADLKRSKLLHCGIFVVSIGHDLIVSDLRLVCIRCSSNTSNCFVDVSPQLDAPYMVQGGMDIASGIHCMLEDVGKLITEFLCVGIDNNEQSESRSGSNIAAANCISSYSRWEERKANASNTNILHMSEVGMGTACHADTEGGGQLLNLVCLKEHGPSVTETGITETSVDQMQGLRSKNKTHFILKTDKSWCVPTLLGVFLGYPIVYWYNATTRNDGETCLSCVPLTVLKVNVEIGDGCPKQYRCHDLYSFSVPSDVLPHLEHKVRQWFKDLMDIMKSQEGLFKNMKLIKETVVLPSVIL